MRRLDFYMGFLLCSLLAFLYRIRGKGKVFLPRTLNNKKILTIKFLGFGSIIMTTPFIAEMKKNYPEAKIHFLTFSDNAPICESIRLIDKTFYLEKKSLGKFIVSLVKNLHQIRKQNYDLVFNLEFFSNFSLLLTTLSKSKLGFCFGGRHEYRKILCHRIISYENEPHVIDKFFNFLRIFVNKPLGNKKQLTELKESQEARKRVLNLLERKQVDISKNILVLININASEMSRIRKWPIEYYQQVISFLLSQKRVKIILIGGKEDIPYVSRMENMISLKKDRVINLAGQTSLKELISLMKVSHLYLGNDSGPLHLAEACHLPNISFFGPESPNVYGHPGPKNYIFYSNLPCSPCLNVYTNKDTSCTDNICLKIIRPDKVIKILQEKYFPENGELTLFS